MKFSVIESVFKMDNGENRKMYGVCYNDGEIIRKFEALVDDSLKIEVLVRILNAQNANLETARQYVENLLYEAYCKYL